MESTPYPRERQEITSDSRLSLSVPDVDQAVQLTAGDTESEAQAYQVSVLVQRVAEDFGRDEMQGWEVFWRGFGKGSLQKACLSIPARRSTGLRE